MLAIVYPLVVAGLAVVVVGCTAAIPQAWPAFHGNGPNTGYIAATSPAAPVVCPRASVCPPGTSDAAWIVPVDYTVFGTPVVGPDGTVFVGNIKGELIAVAPTGSVRWKAELGRSLPGLTIVSSPAVDAAGNVYVIGTMPFEDRTFLSWLFSYTSDGTSNWLRAFWDPPSPAIGQTPLMTTSSPKIVAAQGAVNILVQLQGHQLAVLDQRGNFLSRQKWSCLPGDIQGGLPSCCEFKVPPAFPPSLLLLDPTPAVVTWPRVAPQPDHPVVVVADSDCVLRAWEWDVPRGAPLNPLWQTGNLGRITSPAVATDGRIVVGAKSTRVIAIDGRNGRWLWSFDAKEAVKGSAAFRSGGGLEVYAPGTNHLFQIDDTGQATAQMPLPAGTWASPAVSANRVYITDGDGLHTLTLDLSPVVTDRQGANNSGGPAVGPDGMLYVLGKDGFLIAYPPR